MAFKSRIVKIESDDYLTQSNMMYALLRARDTWKMGTVQERNLCLWLKELKSMSSLRRNFKLLSKDYLLIISSLHAIESVTNSKDGHRVRSVWRRWVSHGHLGRVWSQTQVCDRTLPVTLAVAQAATGGGGDILPRNSENPRKGGIWQCWGRVSFPFSPKNWFGLHFHFFPIPWTTRAPEHHGKLLRKRPLLFVCVCTNTAQPRETQQRRGRELDIACTSACSCPDILAQCGSFISACLLFLQRNED